MSISDFEVLSKVGEGVYSTVWKVKRRSDGLEYAMKKIKLGGLTSKEKENALNEIRILASIDHPNIISYKETFLDDDSTTLCIVMEYAAGGDIAHKIDLQSKRKSLFPESLIWKYFTQMVLGLKNLHDKKILHRDLKPANVFLSKDGKTLKIGDLNVAKVLKTRIARTQVGTPYYMSPEVWNDQPYDSKCDIWSLGCVIYEMCSLKPPFRANDFAGLFKKVVRGNFERIPNFYSTELSDLLSSCLKVNPAQRPTCDQLLKTPVLEKYAKEILEGSDEIKERVELLGTIKITKNIRRLRAQLPKPKYHETKSLGCIEDPVNCSIEPEVPGPRYRLIQVLPNDINERSMEKPNEKSQSKESPPVRRPANKYGPSKEKSFESRLENSPDLRNKCPPVILRAKQEGPKGIRSVEPCENKNNESLPAIQPRRYSKDAPTKEEPPKSIFIKQEYIINKYQNDSSRLIPKKKVPQSAKDKNMPRRVEPPKHRPTPDRIRLKESSSQIMIKHDRNGAPSYRKIDLNMNYMNRYEADDNGGQYLGRAYEVREKVAIKPGWWGQNFGK